MKDSPVKDEEPPITEEEIEEIEAEDNPEAEEEDIKPPFCIDNDAHVHCIQFSKF